MTDGCTGFWLFQLIWPSITECCTVHDMGGSDGVLFDCLVAALPWYLWIFVPLCIGVMGLCRPVYNMIKRRYLKKGEQ